MIIVLVIAILTDVIDGYLARRFKEETRLGTFLDPTADKLFFGGGIIILIIKYHLPWYYLLALSRDVLVAVVSLILLARVKGKKIEFFSSFWGKATTTMQAVTISAIILLLLKFAIPMRMIDFLVLVTFSLGIISSAHYVTIGIKKGYI